MSKKYYVYKRIINDYRVTVTAESATEAIQIAFNNAHDPGELDSEFNDGDSFYPSEWPVCEVNADGTPGERIEVDGSELGDLD